MTEEQLIDRANRPEERREELERPNLAPSAAAPPELTRTLGELGRSEEALVVCDDVVRYAGASEPGRDCSQARARRPGAGILDIGGDPTRP